MTTKGVVNLDNCIEFTTETVTHRTFPDNILILQDHSQADLQITMSEIHILESFQRKYINNFKSVKMAIILPKNPSQAMYSLYYEGIINNNNCESKVFDTLDSSMAWLLKSAIA